MQSSSATCNRCEIFYQGDFIDSLSHTLLAIHVAVARLAGRWQGGAFVDFFFAKAVRKRCAGALLLAISRFSPHPVLLINPASKPCPARSCQQKSTK